MGGGYLKGEMVTEGGGGVTILDHFGPPPPRPLLSHPLRALGGREMVAGLGGGGWRDHLGGPP